MTKTFKELQNGELFVADNAAEIICNRGDGFPTFDYRSHSTRLVFQKRDELGGHVLYRAYGYNDVTPSVYFRIEPNNPVNIVACVI